MEELSMHQPTYLNDNVEVKLTGREAKRTLKNDKIDVRVEITPSNPTEGSWKKWVRMTDLYEIE